MDVKFFQLFCVRSPPTQLRKYQLIFALGLAKKYLFALNVGCAHTLKNTSRALLPLKNLSLPNNKTRKGHAPMTN